MKTKKLLKAALLAGLMVACNGDLQPTHIPASEENQGSVGDSKPPEETPGPVPPRAPTPTPTPTPGRAPQSGAATPLWESKHHDGREWTTHVFNMLDTLGADLLSKLPADYATFCPSYNKFTYTQRKEFWIFLMSAMVRFESNFKPETSFREGFNDSSGRPVVSRGLLQISIESSNGYGCGFRNEQELHDPFMNLSCGVRILNRWVGRDLRMAGQVSGTWRGGARYWSVLRSTSGSYNQIVKLAKATALCSP